MQHNKIIPALLTIPEACQFTGIRRSVLYLKIREGEFRLIKIGRRSMLSSTKLKEWVDKKINEVY